MRRDVLALTADALAVLTNRGLVKRAAREAEAAPPAITEDDDGTLRGTYPDGPAPVLPAGGGGLDRATCTCGAVGTCRHVIGLILAYQALRGAQAATDRADGPHEGADASAHGPRATTTEVGVADWSPGTFSDEQLAARIGERMLAVARRTLRAGYHARVRGPGADDPAPRVDLGAATVRFLVPHDLGFVHSDAVAGSRDDVIALAVWAFRAADRRAPGEPDVRIDVGGDDLQADGLDGSAAESAGGGSAARTRKATGTASPGGAKGMTVGGGTAAVEPVTDGPSTAGPATTDASASGAPTATAGGPSVGGLLADEASAAGVSAGEASDAAGVAGAAISAADEGRAATSAAGEGGRATGGTVAGAGVAARALAEQGAAGRGGAGRAAAGPGAAGRGAAGRDSVADGLGAAGRLADDVLLAGAVHAGAGFGGAVADVRRRLERGNLRWPLAAVGEMAEQLEAYRDRGSLYAPERLAELIVEVHARRRAVVGLGGGARARVLGTEEAAETPLRRARLDGLGCRVVAVGQDGAADERRVVEVFLAHIDTATVLVLRRDWDGDGTGVALGRRRVGGSTVGQLAGGHVVTESAVRNAGRAVRLATSRIARTTVVPSRGAWDGLPAGLLVDDLRALAAELERLPPRVVRPRVAAELVRVVRIAGVERVAYLPGAQRLDAVVTDAAGERATITATHTAAAPGRLDAIAAALARIAAETGHAHPPAPAGPVSAAPVPAAPVPAGSVSAGSASVPAEAAPDVAESDGGGGSASRDRGVGGAGDAIWGGGGSRGGDWDGWFVSGVVRRSGGGIVIEPLAFAGGGEVVLPDLTGEVGGRLESDWGEDEEPLRAAVHHAIGVMAEVAHRGLGHLPPTFGDRLRAAGERLAGVGLLRSAAAVGAFRDALGADPGEEAVGRWVDAYLRLMITAELES
ncbi:hypothetical protein AB0M46_42135 [Dactylosporangium sp. NPDC051485]|uniref:hypothetical protein n=1 Tax=Dactylosporangium sp. NPDC051485 TaxID=3154846 RepID=UPI00343287A5